MIRSTTLHEIVQNRGLKSSQMKTAKNWIKIASNSENLLVIDNQQLMTIYKNLRAENLVSVRSFVKQFHRIYRPTIFR